MISCSGCKRQQPGVDVLCLACIEDLNAWLRQIPDLYDELGSVRLPGSVNYGSAIGGGKGSASAGGRAPVRLEVVDLLDRGVVVAKLEVWAAFTGTVREMCDNLRHHILSVTMLSAQEAGDFYRCIRALCRDLGRTVGEPDDDKPIGKCSRPIDGDVLCRGQLLRTQDGRAVFCRRCGDKPELREQEVWVDQQQAATVSGVPLETVRTWYKRGQVGWSPPLRPGMCWLPIVVRRAADRRTTTVQHSSGIVNHGSGAELRRDYGDLKSSPGSVDDQGRVTQSAGTADRSERGTPDPSKLDRGWAAAVRAGEETPSVLPPHVADGVSPVPQAAGSGEARRVDTVCDDPGPADGAP